MKSAPYIPVDIFSDHGYVYTRTNYYDLQYLEEAYGLIGHGKHPDYENNTSIADIVAAYNYWQTAKHSLFCFHPIFGIHADAEIAFVSDKFDSMLIVIDAQTLDLYFVKQNWMQHNISQLIDKWVDDIEFHNLIKAYHGISTYPMKYAQALIVNRDTDSEYLSIAPYLMRSYNANSIFEPRYYESLIETFNTAQPSTYFEMDVRNHTIVSKDKSEEYDIKDIPRIISLHDKTYDSKSDYIEVHTADSGDTPRFYISRDYKHLVNASTFRNYLINHISLKEFLRTISNKQKITDLELIYLTELLEHIYEN